MKQNKEKSANRKALPKFIIILLLCALGGGLVGLAAGYLGSTILPETVATHLTSILAAIMPWSIWVSSALLLGISVLKYRKASSMFAHWDGEDEALIERAEEQLSWCTLLANLAMMISFFFFAVGMQPATSPSRFPLFLLSFILSMAGEVFLGQKTVDLTRKMNPEKKGSVYDMNSQKTWVASCDENEQRQIGQASFKAFNAVNYTCLGLWLVLVLLSMVIKIGVLPIFLVMLLWGVNLTAYLLEAIRLGRHR